MIAVGVLHPGDMGSAVARCLTSRGVQVWWYPEGRSASTAKRAAEAGMTPADSLSELSRRSAVILSICPPHAALPVAQSLPHFEGIYVDANAISPAQSGQIRRLMESRGARYVDGSIIGSPPGAARTARLYLSGREALTVAELFSDTTLSPCPLDGPGEAASALKMGYAAWTKGTQALALAIGQYAEANGIRQALLDEWLISQPTLRAFSETAARQSTDKGWRWTAEMEQIAATFADSGLPDGFHRAAADMFRRAGMPSSTILNQPDTR